MPFKSGALLSGLFGNATAIFWVLTVVGAILVVGFVVGWLLIVRRGSNREWPVR
jgi:hypothetical protein